MARNTNRTSSPLSATPPTWRRLRRSCWLAPALVAALTWLALVLTLDATGEASRLPEGPGLTVDEMFNVQQGVYLAEAVRVYGLGLLHPKSIQEVFGAPYFLPDHPPLGRLWLGLWHNAVRAVVGPSGFVGPFSPFCARVGSATAFALLVLLVGWTTGRWFGRAAGLAAALALPLMPRLFGHAHLAALETFVGLTYAAAVFGAAGLWCRREGTVGKNQGNGAGEKGTGRRSADRSTGWASSTGRSAEARRRGDRVGRSGRELNNVEPPTLGVAAVAGVLFGLALLSKIQAVLLGPPLALWALWNWRRRAVGPLLVWGVVGLAVFFVGWPWLWLDPWNHLFQYFARTTERATLSVWYFGEKFADRQVPWHYPWVLFLATVPVGLLALGVVGLVDWSSWRRDRRLQLVLACLLFPLVLFSIPGVAVYDGVRLFLVVFPLWAVFVGLGLVRLHGWLRRRLSARSTTLGLAALLALQAVGLVCVHPCYLSYYNLVVGGLPGAQRLGLETTYWGDSVTRSLLTQLARRAPHGTVVAVAPTLHQFQWDDVRDCTPRLKASGVRFVAYGSPAARRATLLLLFRRNADLPAELRRPGPPGQVVAEVRRCGVQLAALYRLDRGR